MIFLRQINAFFTRFWLRWFGPRWTVGCLVLLRDPQGRICLLKHRGRVRPWGLPGGLVTWPEVPEAGLRRELAEELRWQCQEADLPLMLVDSCVSAKFPMLELIYEAGVRVTSDTSELWVLQSSEILEVGWFDDQQIGQLEGLLDRHRSLLLKKMKQT
ncbi:MAG: hypothetical protein RLZZ488_932 [Pseudomonadota bacterium]|jgi:ADP-ribose pyrophosphatase YjhB (NUDIX family)